MRYWKFIIVAVLVFSALAFYAKTRISCEKPQVALEGKCCIDADDNGRCDMNVSSPYPAGISTGAKADMVNASGPYPPEGPVAAKPTEGVITWVDGSANIPDDDKAIIGNFFMARSRCASLGKPGYPSEMFDCIRDLGANISDPEFCQHFKDRMRNDCYSAVGLSKRDPTICAKSQDPNGCYLTVGMGLKDQSVCDKNIKDRNLTDLCKKIIDSAQG